MVASPHLPFLVVVTGYPPNRLFGGGIILHNLLREYPSDRLVIITGGRVLDYLKHHERDCELLPALHVPVYSWHSAVPGVRRLLRSVNFLKIIPATLTIRRYLSKNTALLAVPWGGDFGSELFISAYLAHKLSHAPLLAFELDEWRASLGNHAGHLALLMERIFHYRILRSARTVWVVSDALADTLLAHFTIGSKVMANATDLDRFSREQIESQIHSEKFRILYTGSIYGAQADAIRNVLEAVDSTAQTPYSLVIYTDQSAEQLAAMGIHGLALEVRSAVPLDEIPKVLETADALLLPLSFLQSQSEIVATSLPAKTADYVASGVPILVHAPPYAAVARLAIAEEWALAVTKPDKQEIVQTLERLRLDKTLRRRLVENAKKVARTRHNLSLCRSEFIASIREAMSDSESDKALNEHAR